MSLYFDVRIDLNIALVWNSAFTPKADLHCQLSDLTYANLPKLPNPITFWSIFIAVSFFFTGIYLAGYHTVRLIV